MVLDVKIGVKYITNCENHKELFVCDVCKVEIIIYDWKSIRICAQSSSKLPFKKLPTDRPLRREAQLFQVHKYLALESNPSRNRCSTVLFFCISQQHIPIISLDPFSALALWVFLNVCMILMKTQHALMNREKIWFGLLGGLPPNN